MRILSASETEAWGDAHFEGPLPQAAVRSFHIADPAGKKTALARSLVHQFATGGEFLIRITETGVWPSCENMTLFDVFRAGLGERRTVLEAPGHLCCETDSKLAECLIDMILYFYWDACIRRVSPKIVVRLSHDEILDVIAGEPHLTVLCNAIGEHVTST